MTKYLSFKKRSRKPSSAQSLVEFALILPVVLMLLFVIVELARVLHAWLSVENGARAGVRYAVTAEYNPDKCPPGGCVTEQEERAARIASIHDAAWSGSSSIVRVDIGDATPAEKSYFNVIVCDPEDLILPGSTFGTHQCAHGENPGQPGDPVTIVVEFNHPLLTPILSSIWPELRLTATREAKVETYRVVEPGGTIPPFKSPTPRPTNTPAPSNTSPPIPPPVELCKEWADLHFHRPWQDPTYFGSWLDEQHGWQTGTVAVGQVVLQDVTITQSGRILTVTDIRVGSPGAVQSIRVDQAEASITVPVNLELPLMCSGAGCDYYRRSLVQVDFWGSMDGEYYAFANVYFPEYDTYCVRDISADTSIIATATSTFTPGPSPTRYFPPPSNTPGIVPTISPPTSTPSTPVAPPDV